MSISNVLIVDDQNNWRSALKRVLQKDGFQVSLAISFQEAKNLLEQQIYDLVVLDVRLVDEESFNVEGLDLLHLIKSNTPSTKTIILTGYPEILRRTPESDAFIFKVPENSTFDSQEFRKLVRNMLEYNKGENHAE